MVLEEKELELEQQKEFANNNIVKFNDLSALLPDPDKVAQRADLTKKMLTSLCRVVSPINIVDFGGRPYFDHLACERIAKIVGLVIKINETPNGKIDYEKVIENEKTNHYTVYLTGKIYYAGRPEDYEIQEGSSNSFDDWYKQWQVTDEIEENGKKKKVVVAANALPESKVREKARANLIQRLVKKFLGLDFLWEELEAVGIDRKKCRGFNFNTNSAPDSAEALAKKKEIWNMILELCSGDINLAKRTLQKHTAFNDFQGYTDINKVSEKQLVFLEKKVKAAFDKHLKEMEGINDAANE